MSQAAYIDSTVLPNTRASLAADFAALGLHAGDCVCVHSSLSALKWTIGGARTVILALLDVLGPAGTLMMPAHTSSNSDPHRWQNPPIPEAWWPLVREHQPAYDPATSPTRKMGAIAELFRTWPGAMRSAHPMGSFAALGPLAAMLTAEHEPEHMLDERSPVAALYRADGKILLLGVGHGNNTTLHLAEMRAEIYRPRGIEAAALVRDGERVWATWEMDDFDDEDFDACGAAIEADETLAPAERVHIGRVGQAESRLMRARPLVDAAVRWFEANRPRTQAEAEAAKAAADAASTTNANAAAGETAEGVTS